MSRTQPPDLQQRLEAAFEERYPAGASDEVRGAFRNAYGAGYFDALDHFPEGHSPQQQPAAPIPMRLHCPGTFALGDGIHIVCGELHLDEGEFATKPHHTHSCQACGHTWRPAVVPTVGVRFLPGFRNEAPTEGDPEP